MVVIGHQAVRVAKPSKPVAELAEGGQELPAVIVGEENVTPLSTSGRDVIKSTSEFDAKRSGPGLLYSVIPF